MRRLRSSLARSDLDRDIADRLRGAERLLLEALRLCRETPADSPVEAIRQRRVARDLERAAQAVSLVGDIRPRYDLSDPDLNDTPPLAPRRPDRPSGTKS